MGETFHCSVCKQTYTDKLGYDLHRWKEHPSDSYQLIWSKLAKAGWPGGRYTLAYQENPYY